MTTLAGTNATGEKFTACVTAVSVGSRERCDFRCVIDAMVNLPPGSATPAVHFELPGIKLYSNTAGNKAGNGGNKAVQ